MRNYLDNLVSRTSSPELCIRPQVPSLFEPASTLSSIQSTDFSESPPVRAEEAKHPPATVDEPPRSEIDHAASLRNVRRLTVSVPSTKASHPMASPVADATTSSPETPPSSPPVDPTSERSLTSKISSTEKRVQLLSTTDVRKVSDGAPIKSLSAADPVAQPSHSGRGEVDEPDSRQEAPNKAAIRADTSTELRTPVGDLDRMSRRAEGKVIVQPMKAVREQLPFAAIPKAAAPVIQVTIGRVEVRTSAPSPPVRARPVAKPSLTLEEYLARRAQGMPG